MRLRGLAVPVTWAAWLLLAGGCPPSSSPEEELRLTLTGGTGTSVEEGIADVEIRDFEFDPKAVTIAVGQTVRWTNRGRYTHSVTSGGPGPAAGTLFDQDVSPGGQFELRFERAGTYPYFCRQQSTLMSGNSVTVVAP